MELDTNIKVIEEDFREGKFIKCESDILKLLEIAKNNKRLLNLLSLTYFQLGKTDDAINIMSDLIDKNPLFYEGLVNLGFFKFKLRELKQAEENFRKALSINNEQIEAKTGLCNVMLLSNEDGKRNSEIEKLILEVLQKEPLNIPFRQIAGRFYKSQGQWDVAIKFLERVLTNELIYDLFECIYEVNNQKELQDFIKFCNKTYSSDKRMASLTDFACDQNEILNPYNFCPQSLNFIKEYEIFNKNKKDTILFSSDKELKNNEEKIIYNDLNYSALKYDDKLLKENDEIDIKESFNNLVVKYIAENSTRNIDMFDKFPKKCEVGIKKINCDMDFERNYMPWISAFFLNPKENKEKLNIKFNYIIDGLSVKKKKIREKSFKLSNNKLLIFPSFVSFEIINKEANLDFYQLNIYGKDK